MESRTLWVSVTAGDLRFARSPVMCGHYSLDPIAGAEAWLDQFVVERGLRQRAQLGLYAGPIGSSTLVLMPSSEEQDRLDIRRGALIVGLGELGKLSPASIAETVQAGTLRYLLAMHEQSLSEARPDQDRALTLTPLLLGHTSTTNISIEDSISAVLRGVLEANAQFARVIKGVDLRIERLDFIELYIDTAISAVRAANCLREDMKRDLARLKVDLRPEPQLVQGPGARLRLEELRSTAGYWPRLVVTGEKGSEQTDKQQSSPTTVGQLHIADSLRYLLLSERARAESVEHQRQPGLIESLVEKEIGSNRHDKKLSRMFFQLMLPSDMKETVRRMQRLVLVVDGFTANFPWEMMVANEDPIVTQTRLVRQFASPAFRTQVRSSPPNAAYVVGNPCTEGFRDFFPQFAKETATKGQLDPLTCAEKEAKAVRDLLKTRYEEVVTAIGNDVMARSVIGRLFEKPFHIVHISAHGVFNIIAKDGKPRSGVVLSGGLLLTTAEIRMMETVPEIFFLNCCHLGKTDSLPRNTHRIAYSLARELIEMGVRCVVAAGWEVDEQAGELFATTFYTAMLQFNRCFADALFDARRKVYESFPNLNTWGAYQAYGDPQFVLDSTIAIGSEAKAEWVSPLQFKATLEEKAIEAGAGVTARDAVAYRSLETEARKRLSDSVIALIDAAATQSPEMLKLPSIQYSIGRFFGEIGDFKRATIAYDAAIRAADQNGLLSVKAIEQLANLEAREGEQNEDESLVRSALARMRSLLCLIAPSDDTPYRPEEPVNFQHARHANAERLALFGSACKRMATLVANRKEGFEAAELRYWLKQASDAYGEGAGKIETSAFDPYNAINHLQLAAILGVDTEDERIRLGVIAQYAIDTVTAKAKKGLDFFDAVMPVDAELSLVLLEGQLGNEVERLVEKYKGVISSLPSSVRVVDSVVKQLKMLATFLDRLNHQRDAQAMRRILEGCQQ